MARRVEDREERTSLGDFVLWLALAALVAVVIIGVSTLINVNPMLNSEIRTESQIIMPARVAQ